MTEAAKGADPPSGIQVDVGGLPAEEAVARLVEHAAGLSASDLFFTTHAQNVGVSARHLGVIRRLSAVDAELGKRCIAHIKAVANMDVAERRRPQDGRWIFARRGGTPMDVRINTIPTLYGEDCSLRLLPRDSQHLSLEQLGFLRPDYNQLLNLLQSPSGLILITGPTGSGKTTTLYACLAHLHTGEKKLNAIEDPIEYALPGIRQSQVNARLDVGFPELLRSVLRQSPDVIMIGEVRDPQTAEIAVRAANSGHLVLATLHAPVAVGAVQSMLGLGVHPHFLASSLLGVVAQRLMRTLCPHCKKAFDLADSVQTFDEVRRWLEPGRGQVLYGPGAVRSATGWASRGGRACSRCRPSAGGCASCSWPGSRRRRCGARPPRRA